MLQSCSSTWVGRDSQDRSIPSGISPTWEPLARRSGTVLPAVSPRVMDQVSRSQAVDPARDAGVRG